MLAGVLCQESVPQSEVYSTHNLAMRPAPLSDWILLFLLENIVLPRPVSNEVSFPFSSFCSVLFFPGSFPTQLLKPFLLHCGGGFTVLEFFDYSSCFKLAHIGSLGHYAPFLSSSCYGQGPLLVMLIFRL